MLYRCHNCLALCQQLVWEALGIEQGEDRCPRCKQWSKFTPQCQDAQANRLIFGEKPRVAA